MLFFSNSIEVWITGKTILPKLAKNRKEKTPTAVIAPNRTAE
jgi:hypothetical protein